MSKITVALAGTALAGTMFLFGGTVGYLVAITHPPAFLHAQQAYEPSSYAPPAPAPVAAPALPAPSPAAAPSPVPPGPQVDPLSVPSIGHEIMQQIVKLHGYVRPQGGSTAAVDPSTVVTVFFDPRCPFCHRLYQAIDGKVPVRWIPVPVLANPEEGVRASAMILNAQGDKGRAMDEAFAYVGEGAVGHTVQQRQQWLDAIKPTDSDKHLLQDNISAFVAVHKARPGSIGVPSVLIPHPDGSLTLRDGYEPGDENAIIADWKRGR
ncbi:hypothetical protein AD951_04485 [Acetobacter malorum]|uniref:Thioredoxin-like fold domain-containing protein n=1 Tax=Acetobacter malorum TaxID=178901 RepID=A0A149UPW1_9PROT|nr:hypothetical protein [Acetobacter malorum]KXV69938.1 hypothetical protein AD951_04485 [Acetobacter malorum]